MSEESAGTLAHNVIIAPVLKQLEGDERNISAVHTLRLAFKKAEKCFPGISHKFVSAVIETDCPTVAIAETLLRLASQDEESKLQRSEPEFISLDQKARSLKAFLSIIPDQIAYTERARLLKTIKDVANAIRELLESLNEVEKKYENEIKEDKKSFEAHKRSFVKNSRTFSDKLRAYFKEQETEENIFVTANKLVDQTNALLGFFTNNSF